MRHSDFPYCDESSPVAPIHRPAGDVHGTSGDATCLYLIPHHRMNGAAFADRSVPRGGPGNV